MGHGIPEMITSTGTMTDHAQTSWLWHLGPEITTTNMLMVAVLMILARILLGANRVAFSVGDFFFSNSGEKI